MGRTTYIFGAGASFHAGYPFVRMMGDQLLEWMRRQSPCGLFDFANSATFLKQRFGNDIEDLFAGVQKEIDAQRPGYSIYANVHKPCLVEGMRQWFASIHRTAPAIAYELFASRVVKPGDRIVTFNYDIALDSKLRKTSEWSVGDGYGFTADGLPTGSTVKIFKLHGSINWFAVLFGGLTSGPMVFTPSAAMGHRPVFTDADLTALGYPTHIQDLAFPRAGAAAIQPLILPTSRKRFYFQSNFGREWQPFWDKLWRAARRAVRTSDRVVICGYGMYPIDRRGCNLLLSGKISGQIEVCSGDDSGRIVKQLRDQGRDAQVADQVLFQNWVGSHAAGGEFTLTGCPRS